MDINSMDLFYTQLAAGIAAVLLLVTVIFEVMLASGAPWGEMAWGGYVKGVLPKKLRIVSGIAALFWTVAIVVILEYGQVFSIGVNTVFTRVSFIVIVGLLAIGIIMNSISKSRKEKLIWTPVVSFIFIACLFILFN